MTWRMHMDNISDLSDGHALLVIIDGW